MKYIIIHGNPVDGFACLGPFDSMEAAAEAGRLDDGLHAWWIAPLIEHTPVLERE